MISAVFVTGRLGEQITPLSRYVEVDRVIPGPTGRYEVDKIPVFTYAGEGCFFMQAPKGSFITVKGHMETDKTLGVIVKMELEEILPMGQKKKV